MSELAHNLPLHHVNETVTQLKEMRHYSKNNVEQLTAQWLMFDGELRKLGRAGTIEGLMTQQGEDEGYSTASTISTRPHLPDDGIATAGTPAAIRPPSWPRGSSPFARMIYSVSPSASA